MSIKCEWTEQQIIDDLLAEAKDRDTSRHLHNHLTYCKHCQELYDYWASILINGEISERTGPSPKVKARIFNSIAQPNKKWTINKKQVIAACIGFLILSAGFLAGRWSIQTDSHAFSSPKNGLQETRTGYLPKQKMAYRVVPVHARNTDGYVWVNPNTKDIMLFLDGLKPIEGRDYQAWLITSNNKESAGILQIDQNFAHVIVHNPHIPTVERIIISIEPQGGSAIQTGPNAIDLDLRSYEPRLKK
ncbi:MAG: anti-sigma factor [Tuberibacillus sp.]